MRAAAPNDPMQSAVRNPQSAIRTALLLLLAALPAAARSQRAEDRYPATFRYEAARPAKAVYLAGTFNGWSRTATPMLPDGAHRVWTRTLTLPPGEVQYKFVVDGTWTLDPKARTVDDGNGNQNSLLVVTPRGYDQPARVGDGHITGSAVYHTPRAPWARRLTARRLELTLRARRDDVQRVFLLRPGAPRLPMRLGSQDALFSYWRATVDASPSKPLRYAFLMADGSRTRLYDRRSWLLDGTFAPEWITLTPNALPLLVTPEWPRDAVFYQIFPDRFADGDRSNDPKDVVRWDAKPTGTNRFGGDLKGVRDHLAYLKALGVNALYFNPLFAARSNHRYDTTDYHRVDPQLGTNADLAALVKECHASGWHVILDGVFNHTGVDFAPFRDLERNGAKSPYRSWYFVKQYPVSVTRPSSYVGWFNIPWMPKLNVMNPAARDYLLDVGTRWMRQAGIDGWRLDAANEVDSRFWRVFRQRVKAAKPDAYLVGEIWGDAGPWLQGDQFDSVMDYPWRQIVLDYLARRKVGPAEFDRRLARLRDAYPPAAEAVLFNMLGSHDTERLLNLCGGDKGRERLAVLFQMTYPGTPCVYYGDEVGMAGGRDPDDRRGMVWDPAKQDRGLLAFYRAVIALRRGTPALRRGDYATLAADDARGLYAFARRYRGQEARVYLNTGAAPLALTVPHSLRLALATAPEAASLSGGTLTLAPGQGAVVVGGAT